MKNNTNYSNKLAFPTKFRNSFLICDENGELLSKIEFEYLSPFLGGFAIFGKKTNSSNQMLFGIVCAKGIIVLDNKYYQIHRLINNPLKFILFQGKKRNQLFDAEINKVLYDGIHTYYEEEDCDYLVINKGAQYSCEPEDGTISWSYDGESYEIIDYDGNKIETNTYCLLDYPKENIVRGHRYGTIIMHNDFIENSHYLDSDMPCGGNAFYINLVDDVIFSDEYTYCWNFCEGIGRVAIGGQMELIYENEDTNLFRNPIGAAPYSFCNISYGYINKYGVKIFETEIGGKGYDFINSHARVHNKERKWTWINTKGEIITDFIFKKIFDFSKDGIALAVTNDDLYCYVNGNGEVVSDKYKKATPFVEGFAFVINDFSEFIDLNFKKTILSPLFSAKTNLIWNKNMIANIKLDNNSILFHIAISKKLLEKENGSFKYINKEFIYFETNKSSEIYDIEVYKISMSTEFKLFKIATIKSITSHKIRNGYLFVNKTNKEGVFTLDGEEIVPIEYDKVVYIDGLFAVYKNKKDDRYSILGYYSGTGLKYF